MTVLIVWDWPETPILIGVVLVVALVLHAVLVWAIRRTTNLALRRNEDHNEASRAGRALDRLSGLASARAVQRTKTLGSLLRSIAFVVITVITVLTVLSIVGVPLAPLLASAGVGGVALAFGAQSLVKDFLSGIFMMIEDQYGVGDWLTVGDISGTVEEVTLRITRIRDGNGTIWYVRNGEINQVGNLSQGYSTAFVDIPVAYDTDPATALDVLQKVVDEIADSDEWQESLLEKPSVLGVDSISGGTMNLRILVKSPPNQQYGVSREIRERAQIALAAAGVKGPALTIPTKG